MKVEFVDAAAAGSARLIARIVDQDSLPVDLEPVVAAGAKASRFSGKAGQVFETFVERNGAVVRLALPNFSLSTVMFRRP